MATIRGSLTIILAGLLAAACAGGGGGDGGGGGGGSGTSGIAVPQEISALPAKAGGAPSLLAGARTALKAGIALQSLPADSDYEKAQTFKFVDERALSQFDIFNTIFKALGQTHYADPENLGAGAYGTMVAWEEERGDGQNSKRLVPWVVDSSMIVEGGQEVNRVNVWMTEMMEDGGPSVIKVELKIYEAPTQRPDGSYADYGVWTINAAFDDLGIMFFVASASRAADGSSIVTVHEKEGPGGEKRGIMHRSDESGLGKVVYQECMGPDCQPQDVTVAYVYDAHHVALLKGGETLYRDRESVIDLVHRYGLFDAETGADVAKTRSFGFPVRYTDAQNRQRHGYYGAWQGRHQLWADGQQRLPEGTTVVRADRPPNQTAESYTVSAPFTGTLVKRTLVPGAIDDVKGIVVETFVNKSIQLTRNAEAWTACVNPQWHQFEPPTCGEGSGPFGADELATLASDPANPRRFVNINYMAPWQDGQPPPQPRSLVYVTAPDAGFYETDWVPGSNQQPTSNGTPFTVPDGQSIWVNIGGSVYITYDGAGWIEKTMVAFDQETWTPTFADGGSAYQLELDREYYINNPGSNYVVKRTGANSYDVQIELQSVANPVNATSFVPAGTVFKPQWGGGSTYEFVTDSQSPKYLKLVYKTVSEGEQGKAIGDVVQTGQWGLVAYVDDVSAGVQYNWDYPQDGQDWGSQQFLLAGGAPVLLDDPIRLDPVTLVNDTGERTFSLQFDGSWVGGLPDVYRDLERSGFEITPEIQAKIFTIPGGTEVVDAVSGKHYLFKPLQMNEYLATIEDPGDLDPAAAAALDLGSVPSFVPHHMGPLPEVPVKYSEGKPVD